MDGKSLHMADFGLLRTIFGFTLFAYRENHRSNAVNLSKNTVGINVPEISDALKYYKSHQI
jgi:hypothetical protein